MRSTAYGLHLKASEFSDDPQFFQRRAQRLSLLVYLPKAVTKKLPFQIPFRGLSLSWGDELFDNINVLNARGASSTGTESHSS
jgi:hypothetical protein